VSSDRTPEGKSDTSVPSSTSRVRLLRELQDRYPDLNRNGFKNENENENQTTSTVEKNRTTGVGDN